jgi:hypothetical protein
MDEEQRDQASLDGVIETEFFNLCVRKNVVNNSLALTI